MIFTFPQGDLRPKTKTEFEHLDWTHHSHTLPQGDLCPLHPWGRGGDGGVRQGAGRGHHACRLLLSGGDLDDNESDDDDHDHDDDDHDHDCHMRQQIGELALTIPAVLMRGQNLEHNAYFNLFRQNIKNLGNTCKRNYISRSKYHRSRPRK